MTIKRKLILLTILPTIAILLFSLNHILDKYNTYKTHVLLLSSSTLINYTANVLYQLQLERELLTNFMNSTTSDSKIYFTNLLAKQQIKSDVVIKKFNEFLKNLDNQNINITHQKFTDNITILLESISSQRKSVQNKTATPYTVFTYFSYINSQLLELADGIKFYIKDEKTQSNIMLLKKLLIFQELSAQERGFISLLNSNILSSQDLEKLNTIWFNQDIAHENIKIILNSFGTYEKLKIIENKEANLYINKVKNMIRNSENMKLNIDSKLWFETSSNIIDDYHILGRYVFSQIVVDIKNKNSKLYNSLIYQIIFTIITILTLLLGVRLIANSIDKSLAELDNGMDDFFNFLNFKTDAPKDIETDSDDELSNIAHKINKQIKFLVLNLENDKDFINETTQIVTQMKYGNFNEQPHLEPTNPSLIELKSVFVELIKLISNKITEQTKSLEKLNKTLEDKVNLQTSKLKKHIVEITCARDIAIEAEKSKDDFLASMSHEIRTPLHAILGFVTVLNKRIEDEKSLNYLNIIDTSGQALLEIINDILDFSKIKSGNFTISPQIIDPMKEFSDTTLLFASKAYEKHLTYAVYIDPNLPKSISVDNTRIKQILSNLLSNAIKFTPQDGVVKVNISIHDNSLIISVQDSGIGIPAESQSKIFNPFSQADSSTTRKYGGTGLGLSISSKLAGLMNGTLTFTSQENLGSIFKLIVPVHIVNATQKSLLDLSKIKKYKFAILNTSKEDEIFARLIKKYLIDFGISDIIELNEYSDEGYDILFFVPDDLYNDEIVDSKIVAIAMLKSNMVTIANFPHITSLYAPFAPTSIIEAISNVTVENIQQTPIVKTQDDIKLLFSGHILVAEDNKTNQLLISLILDDYDIKYTIVDDGKKAVETFKQKKFDLILMDENMPELNGIGAMKQIKEYEIINNLIKTPIVALTSNALTTDVENFFNEGMDGFVAKPINNSLLEKELHKHLIVL